MRIVATLAFAVASALFFGLAYGINTFFISMGCICLFSGLALGFQLFLKYLDGDYE